MKCYKLSRNAAILDLTKDFRRNKCCMVLNYLLVLKRQAPIENLTKEIDAHTCMHRLPFRNLLYLLLLIIINLLPLAG